MTEKAAYPMVGLSSELSILMTRFPEHNLKEKNFFGVMVLDASECLWLVPLLWGLR